MKFIKILLQIVILFMFYMAGECVNQLLHLPIPGSIVGLLLLWVALVYKIFPLKWIESGSNFILTYLPFFFIPATVGVMNYFHIFTGKGVYIVLILVLSTLVTIITAGSFSQFLAQQRIKERD